MPMQSMCRVPSRRERCDVLTIGVSVVRRQSSNRSNTEEDTHLQQSLLHTWKVTNAGKTTNPRDSDESTRKNGRNGTRSRAMAWLWYHVKGAYLRSFVSRMRFLYIQV